MNVFRDGVIAFFSAVGMTTVVWLLAGALLHAGRPTIPGLLLVLPARGDAPALEHDVRELRRVQGSLPLSLIHICHQPLHAGIEHHQSLCGAALSGTGQAFQ